ncbi:uncharacterized protein LOC123532335 [Mercenaria mercenaria]|uniref:uncharacterized protein LOC123532335 n=1 Tax=Mercenaria mercenaria TaxID=6596 RepID=UPI00234E7473|nr:uncharacterized protein LOC123532335 [Mercenaria mercenaria]XP_053374681.1 uncharacterized protein LOC123532335 [Mercenaria mercenaria]XP_053374682.1 uncharacterized protein LOC123532335 [Mercenaria mercenaria]
MWRKNLLIRPMHGVQLIIVPTEQEKKCLYSISSQTGTSLKLVHETPVHHYKDTVSFTFAQGSSADTCNVHGYSTSQTWYAVLDYSTNYCNMRNLLEGSNLHTSAGFTETTSDSICTQYSKRNYDKY